MLTSAKNGLPSSREKTKGYNKSSSSIITDNKKNKYIKGRILGKGGFARCYELTPIHKDDVGIYAGKVIDKATLVKPKTKQKLSTEIKIHKSLDHENIVKFYRFFEDNNYVYIMLELCKNQSMMELLKKRKRFSEDETRFFMMQTLQGVKYMHDNRVIHRDLKLGNMFLGEGHKIKIGDFGLAAQLEHDGERKLTVCGTPNYIAPEIISGKNGHSYEVDIWSIGVILYTLLFGKPPFETDNVKTTYRMIKTNQYNFPEHVRVSPEAKALIKRILTTHPEHRPNVDEIIQDPFFTNHAIPSQYPSYSSSSYRKSSSRPHRYELPREPLRPVHNNHEDDGHGFGKRADGMGTKHSPHTGRFSEKENHGHDGMARRPHARQQQQIADMEVEHNYYAQPPNHQQQQHPPQTSERKPIDNDDHHHITLLHQTLTTFDEAANNGGKAAGSRMRSNAPEDNHAAQPKVWVVLHADYSQKYGLAYKMNNGVVGAHYNDSTKLVLMPDERNFDYMERRRTETGSYDEPSSHTMLQPPETLNKKVTLIKYFKNHLEKQERQDPPTNMDTVTEFVPEDYRVYVKRWLKTKHAIIFRLSNKTVQVRFHDRTEIILSSEARIVTYTNREGLRKTLTLSSIIDAPEPDVARRLKYTKDILYQLIRNKS
eukprot:gb/GECH01014941.1/.p1 GENE.gb/GECH01014941.1/~~gb/GECH01014941.1/.p1  ORF type:complete len:654 (+),score=134.41 gb/GECH01014941.1/:1-1962(+)